MLIKLFCCGVLAGSVVSIVLLELLLYENRELEEGKFFLCFDAGIFTVGTSGW